MKRRFYYNRSIVYGWCVYDRQTNTPAYEACAEYLPQVDTGNPFEIQYVSPLCDSEYQAMRLCTRLNLAIKRMEVR